MKKSVTNSIMLIQDNLPVLVRSVLGIAEELIPTIKEGLENKISLSYELRDLIKQRGRETDASELIEDLPFSCLISVLPLEMVKRTLLSFAQNEKSFQANGGFQSAGEFVAEIAGMRAVFTTNSETLRERTLLPDIQVMPIVEFGFNTKNDNSGAVGRGGDGSSGWIPHTNVIPTGAFAQVERITYHMHIDIDSLICAWLQAKRTGMLTQEQFVDRVVGSGCLTFLAGVSKSIGLYNSALSELINPVANVLDEAFLEYTDLDAPQYSLVDMKKFEPHWLRLTVSKVSAIIDATIRGSTGNYSKSPNVFSAAMQSLIGAYFLKKYLVTNTLYTNMGTGTDAFTYKLSEKMMDQITDPMVRSNLRDSLTEMSTKGYHYAFREDEGKSGLVSFRHNVIKMLQKTLILVAYTSILVNASTGLDRKYNQFNNFFGRKGGYKGMVKKMVQIIWLHLKEILEHTESRLPGGDVNATAVKYALPILRWGRADGFDAEEFSLFVQRFWAALDKDSSYAQTFANIAGDKNLAPLDQFNTAIYSGWDELTHNLNRLSALVKGAVGSLKEVDNDEKGIGYDLEINREVNHQIEDGAQHSNIPTKSLEAFIEETEQVEQLSLEDEFGYGTYSVLDSVGQNIHVANNLEDELEVSKARTFAENDPMAEEAFKYNQQVEKALERFDAVLSKLILKK